MCFEGLSFIVSTSKQHSLPKVCNLFLVCLPLYIACANSIVKNQTRTSHLHNYVRASLAIPCISVRNYFENLRFNVDFIFCF